MGKMADLARTGEGKQKHAKEGRYPKGAKPTSQAEVARRSSSPMSPQPVNSGDHGTGQTKDSGGGSAQEPMKKMPQTPPTNSTAAQFDSNPKGAKLGGSSANPMKAQTVPMYTPSTKQLPEPKPTSKVSTKLKPQVPPTNETKAQFKS